MPLPLPLQVRGESAYSSASAARVRERTSPRATGSRRLTPAASSTGSALVLFDRRDLRRRRARRVAALVPESRAQ
ncbi:hypothetical protein CVS37_05140 [Burkholderia lata]|nr:hypothetical protein CVS37_05140 [Burkholderia lata]